ncbi:hypothetical protein B2J88_52805, partial [Rhodococcus sp. SRB_17]|nr:hypothetical protein [Rhodococcus sp. SRB_17]
SAGSFPFTLTADNGVGTPATVQITVTVTAAPVAPSFIDLPAGPLTAVAVTPFTPHTFTATGTPAPVITLTDPTKLPPGMT